MRRLFVVIGVLAVMVVLYAGCAKGTTAASARTITGELEYLTVPLEWYETVPLEYGNANVTATVTVKTPQGPQTIQLASNTTYTLEGKACAIDDIGKALVEGDTTYNCTIVIDPCEPEGFVARYLSVTKTVK